MMRCTRLSSGEAPPPVLWLAACFRAHPPAADYKIGICTPHFRQSSLHFLSAQFSVLNLGFSSSLRHTRDTFNTLSMEMETYYDLRCKFAIKNKYQSSLKIKSMS